MFVEYDEHVLEFNLIGRLFSVNQYLFNHMRHFRIIMHAHNS